MMVPPYNEPYFSLVLTWCLLWCTGHLRPERPPHLHPDMLHPALREKGRAIPQQKPFSVASVTGLDGSAPRVSQLMPTAVCIIVKCTKFILFREQLDHNEI